MRNVQSCKYKMYKVATTKFKYYKESIAGINQKIYPCIEQKQGGKENAYNGQDT